ncbi:hypothetical protein EVAR_103238_1 [Eumeta japonica]|uniref:Uncharacterized protein n=1 Tax=Eumeta variegata TaxID=151549 RepID=A0A4C1X8R3_EUMVA|nr:hypothetical protein EVAR_103238_1 [Eumeta japonica]
MKRLADLLICRLSCSFGWGLGCLAGGSGCVYLCASHLYSYTSMALVLSLKSSIDLNKTDSDHSSKSDDHELVLGLSPTMSSGMTWCRCKTTHDTGIFPGPIV